MTDQNASVTVAVANSTFHVDLLIQNTEKLDAVLCMNAGLVDVAKEMTRQLGTQVLPLPLESFRSSDLISFRRARVRNRRVYEDTRSLVGRFQPQRIILFVEGKPMTRFLYDLAAEQGIACELWEDGLSHYIDFFVKYVGRSKEVAKLAAGYYPRGLFQRRFPREGLTVRDRFRERNLAYAQHGAEGESANGVLFIGQPLVDDRLVSRTRYVSSLARLQDEIKVPLRYLIHPRERPETLAGTGIDVISANESAEAYCARNDYRAFLSAFSTSNLNIGRFHKNYYVPGLFGLRRVAGKLRAADFIPVKVVDTANAIELSNE